MRGIAPNQTQPANHQREATTSCNRSTSYASANTLTNQRTDQKNDKTTKKQQQKSAKRDLMTSRAGGKQGDETYGVWQTG